MKKILSLFVIVGLIFAFVSCANNVSSEPVGGSDESWKNLTIGDGSWTGGSSGDDFTSISNGDERWTWHETVFEKNGSYKKTCKVHAAKDKTTQWRYEYVYSGNYYIENGNLTIRVKNATLTIDECDGTEKRNYAWKGNFVYTNSIVFLIDGNNISYYTFKKRSGKGNGLAGTWIEEDANWRTRKGKLEIGRETYKYVLTLTEGKEDQGTYTYIYKFFDEPEETESGTWKLKDGYTGDFATDYLQKNDNILCMGRLAFTKTSS